MEYLEKKNVAAAIERREDAGLAAAIIEAKGVVRLAQGIGVTRQAVSGWKRIPPERVIAVEQFTGVSREVLRPDLHPPKTKQRARVGA